jgi:hypothetical protein
MPAILEVKGIKRRISQSERHSSCAIQSVWLIRNNILRETLASFSGKNPERRYRNGEAFSNGISVSLGLGG